MLEMAKRYLGLLWIVLLFTASLRGSCSTQALSPTSALTPLPNPVITEAIEEVHRILSEILSEQIPGWGKSILRSRLGKKGVEALLKDDRYERIFRNMQFQFSENGRFLTNEYLQKRQTRYTRFNVIPEWMSPNSLTRILMTISLYAADSGQVNLEQLNQLQELINFYNDLAPTKVDFPILSVPLIFTLNLVTPVPNEMAGYFDRLCRQFVSFPEPYGSQNRLALLTFLGLHLKDNSWARGDQEFDLGMGIPLVENFFSRYEGIKDEQEQLRWRVAFIHFLAGAIPFLSETSTDQITPEALKRLRLLRDVLFDHRGEIKQWLVEFNSTPHQNRETSVFGLSQLLFLDAALVAILSEEKDIKNPLDALLVSFGPLLRQERLEALAILDRKFQMQNKETPNLTIEFYLLRGHEVLFFKLALGFQSFIELEEKRRDASPKLMVENAL